MCLRHRATLRPAIHGLLVALSLIWSCSSCKLFCKDKHPAARKDYTGQELRTDGYYYMPLAPDYQGKVSYELYFFYRNGVFLEGSSNGGTPQSYVEQLRQQNWAHDKQSYWGTYTISGGSVNLEAYQPSHTCSKVSGYSFAILNDMAIRNVSGDTLRFVPSPKPDSTNDFF